MTFKQFYLTESQESIKEIKILVNKLRNAKTREKKDNIWFNANLNTEDINNKKYSDLIEEIL